MTESQRERVDEFFDDLIERDPGEWEAVLAGIEDAEVRAEVASLLDHTGPATKSLNTSIGEMMQAATASGEFEDRSIGPGTRFERYRIERRIGQGGMGDVYEAVRDNDFHKRVALKIVRYGLDSDFARGRFQQERQMLAGLEHPFIARLLDGGEAANGCPYLVLEYVDGVPIDIYCRTCSRADILKLFLKVCEAVEYAHRNLIIHRDLKPANILVTADGDPKLLDFGIAKLLDPGANVTQTMAIALTPQYASPEQVRGQSITTASDVYSLGVILYQLLTGRKPYAVETTTPFEMERVICQEPPASPGIGNELDDILMMALRKEPERRYPSVLQFAQDIERYMDGRPVSAAPDTFRYRSGKFLGRHKIGIAAVAALILTLSGGLASTLYQKRKAERRFEDVRKLANIFLFQFHDAIVDVPGTTKARALVVKTAQEYLDNLSRSAGSDLELQAELAKSYGRVADAQGLPRMANLGDKAGAEANYRRAIGLYETLLKKSPKYTLETVQAWESLAFFYVNEDRVEDAHAALARAFVVAEPLRRDTSARTLLALSNLYEVAGDVEYQRGKQDLNVQYLRQSVDYLDKWRKVQQGGDPAEIGFLFGSARLRLGRALMDVPDQAEGELKGALAELERAHAAQPQNVRYRRNLIAANVILAAFYGGDNPPALERFAAVIPLDRSSLDLLKPLIAAEAGDMNSRELYLEALLDLSLSEMRAKQSSGVAESRQGLALWEEISRGPTPALTARMASLDSLKKAVIVLASDGAHREANELAMRNVRERRALLARLAPGDDDLWYLVSDLQVAAEAARSAGANAEADRLFNEAIKVSTPFAGAADRIAPTAFVAADFYAALRRDRAATARCGEAAEWQAKETEVWRYLAATNAYAASRLQRMQNASQACPQQPHNYFFDR